MVQVFSIPLDYITMVFALYNWSLVGLFAVFGPGPLWLQQIYLTVISSLMVSQGFYIKCIILILQNIGICFDRLGRVHYMDFARSPRCLG